MRSTLPVALLLRLPVALPAGLLWRLAVGQPEGLLMGLLLLLLRLLE